MQIEIKSKIESQSFGEKLGKLCFEGMCITLNGDLGAGKTTFVKGFAEAVDINETVTSPTFTLLKTYQAKEYTIVHVDAYRLDGSCFDELDDYINDENVLFIEWSNCLASQDLIENHLSIDIKYVSKNQRIFTIKASGERYENILKELELND